MTCCVPVIVPNAGGVLSYANSNNAWLCQPAVDGFASAVRAVFADPSERERGVACARITAQQHDWSLIAARYFDLIDSLHRKRFEIQGFRSDTGLRSISPDASISRTRPRFAPAFSAASSRHRTPSATGVSAGNRNSHGMFTEVKS